MYTETIRTSYERTGVNVLQEVTIAAGHVAREASGVVVDEAPEEPVLTQGDAVDPNSGNMVSDITETSSEGSASFIFNKARLAEMIDEASEYIHDPRIQMVEGGPSPRMGPADIDRVNEIDEGLTALYEERLSNLRSVLETFGRFPELSLEPGVPVVAVGLNASGKSLLIEALSVAFDQQIRKNVAEQTNTEIKPADYSVEPNFIDKTLADQYRTDETRLKLVRKLAECMTVGIGIPIQEQIEGLKRNHMRNTTRHLSLLEAAGTIKPGDNTSLAAMRSAEQQLTKGFTETLFTGLDELDSGLSSHGLFTRLPGLLDKARGVDTGMERFVVGTAQSVELLLNTETIRSMNEQTGNPVTEEEINRLRGMVKVINMNRPELGVYNPNDRIS